MISTCNQSCDTCIKKNYSIFSDLNEESIAVLHKNSFTVSYKKGELIYKEGTKPSELMCLQSGKVKAVRDVKNKELVIGLYGSGNLIGFNTFLNDKSFNTSAVALEESVVCYINKDDFLSVFNACSALALKIVNVFSQQMEMCQKRMLTLMQSNLRGRLADALIVMSEIYGINDDGTLNVLVPRRDIAAIANMTTANAIRTLSEFRKEKIVEIAKNKIKILKADTLEMMRKYQ